MSATYCQPGGVCLFCWFTLFTACDERQSAPERSPDAEIAGTDWRAVIAPDEASPDLEEASVELFIPDHVDEVRGVLVFSHAGVGASEYLHYMWRSSAKAHGYGLMKATIGAVQGNWPPWEYPEQSAKLISRIFDAMAELTAHPELGRCPLVFFGHSAGGFWVTRLIALLPERTAGFVAFHGSLESNEMFSPRVLAIPGLFLVAEYDPIWIRDRSAEDVENGRARGARWSLVLEPDAGHWDADSGRWLMAEFVETVLHRRVGPAADSSTGPAALVELPEEQGWLGQLVHRSVYDGDEEFEDQGKEVIISAGITPCCPDPELASRSNWLISERFAESWLSLESSGVAPRD